jgi:two-component system sensor histidine kinase UhpB
MKTEIKILIAEHDPNDLELLHHELKKSGIKYVSEAVQNEQDYIYALGNFIPDIILSDYTFPSFNGPAAFKIREQIAPETPFIFVSGTIGEEKSIELIKNGVTDYALKDKLFTLHLKVIRALKESKEKEQKKKAEEDLILSEGKLARAQQLAHMGSWELDFSGNIMRWSEETCRIHGVSPDKNRLSFKTWLSFIHPEDLGFASEKLKIAVDSLLDFSIDYRIVHGNGIVRHIHSESKPEFDANGKPSGLYGTSQDVTEMVLLENKLMAERRTKQSEITAAVLTAQENERADIGRELHDNLNQILGATKMYIELAKKDEENRAMLLQKSSVCIVNVIDMIRKISKTLASPGVQVGLFNSIKVLIADLIMAHPIEIQFRESNIKEEYLNEKLKLTVFRIVQEQMNNILKHSKATMAVIRLSRHENELILRISDNGSGTDILKEIDGVGIQNIKSRAELHNGAVTIVSNPGKGYKLKVALSLNGYMDKPAVLMPMPLY